MKLEDKIQELEELIKKQNTDTIHTLGKFAKDLTRVKLDADTGLGELEVEIHNVKHLLVDKFQK